MLKKLLMVFISVVCFTALTACSVPSASGSASPDRTLTDEGITIGAIIKEDSLNKNLANFETLKKAGETIEATIEGNTLTFYVTLDKDISNFTPDLQAKYTAEMKSLIDTLDEEYDGFPDTTFIYNLMNKSGDTLMTLTQEYIEQ